MASPLPATPCAERYFNAENGGPLTLLLQPISPEAPSGRWMRWEGGYDAIREARRHDDPSMPQGVWQVELKRADWPQVSRLCSEALASQSKDMQLVAWLTEARLQLDGFTALAPCFELMATLTNTYWGSLHPCPSDDDAFESRANIIAWLNSALLPTLRQTPITAGGGNEGLPLSWYAWELAQRSEASRAQERRQDSEPEMSVARFMAALAVSPGDFLKARYTALDDALAALDKLDAEMDARMAKDAPSLNALKGLLSDIHGLLHEELAKRGLHHSESAPAESQTAQAEEADDSSNVLDMALADRAEAYACLAAAADFLMRLEPHSPVPYLVHRAIEWGQLNTVELYQELFVKKNGQISIFDLLGLSSDARPS